MFASLTYNDSRVRSFLAGAGVQVVGILLLLFVAMMAPKVVPIREHATQLTFVEPVIPHVTPTPIVLPVHSESVTARLTVPRSMPTTKLAVRIKAPEIHVQATSAAPLVAVPVVVPKGVVVNQFAVAPAPSTVEHPALTVQSTGFGGDGPITKGQTRGVVTNSGFGSVGTIAQHPQGGVVTSTGFGAQQSAAKSITHSDVPVTPVEVISKPVPQYSDEARRLHISGSVQMEVKFTATGEVKVLRVINGLGHGLDQEACSVAEHIKFKPAVRQGQSVDSTAVINIIFELAS